jgi:hypothetical protein
MKRIAQILGVIILVFLSNSLTVNHNTLGERWKRYTITSDIVGDN